MRAALDLLMLYMSKGGTILFGVLILPQFSRLLGSQQFGIVASVFALQSLLLVLDLGMATIVARELASAHTSEQDHRIVWIRSRKIIVAFYAALTLAGLVIVGVAPLQLSLPEVLLALALFFILTVQNVGQAVLLARRQYLKAGAIQFLGVTFRGVGTLAAIRYVSADLTTFLTCQVLCAAVHMIITDKACRTALCSPGLDQDPTSWRHCAAMAAKGRSLMVYGLAGAAVMQLDKVIISYFSSPSSTTHYYLATSLCLTPLSVFAGPVSQYFQPRVIKAITEERQTLIEKEIAPFVRIITLVTIIPTALLWLARKPLITLWLRDTTHLGLVSAYCAVLLPGIAVGALSYVPYTILIAKQDFHFQSVASAILSTLTLALATIAALFGSIMSVCWIYAAYHTVSTLVSWARCVHLQSKESSRYATFALRLSIKTIGVLSVPLFACGLGELIYLYSKL